jgi:hypothetical protein
MPTPQEILERQRTATRMSPGGVRSAVYGQPAGQVPQGVLSPGTAPMPAVSSNLQMPNSTVNPAMREALTSRPPIDQSIVQRAAQNAAQNGRPLYVGGSGGVGAMPPTGAGLAGARPAVPPVPGAPGVPGVQPSGRFAGVNNPNVGPGGSAEARAWQAQRPGAPTATAAPATAAPGAPQPGVIGRAAGTGKKVLGAASKTAASIVGPAQIGMGANELAKGNTAEGAARLGTGVLATTQVLPKSLLSKIPLARSLPGPVGLAAAASLTATDAMGLPAYGLSPAYLGMKAREAALQNDTTRGWINTARGWMGEGPLPAPQGAQPAPQRAPVPNVYGPTLADQTGVPQPKTVAPGVADGSAEERAINAQDNAGPPRGPITRAARGATMSPEGQAQVARLQQMAGQPQTMPIRPAAPVGPNGQTDDRYYRAFNIFEREI